MALVTRPRLRLPPAGCRTVGSPVLFPVRGARSRWAILAIPAFFQDRVSVREFKPAGTTRSGRKKDRMGSVVAEGNDTANARMAGGATGRPGSDARRVGSLTRAPPHTPGRARAPDRQGARARQRAVRTRVRLTGRKEGSMRNVVRIRVLVPALLLLVAGCATRDWVRGYVAPKEAELDQRIVDGRREGRRGDPAA